MEHAAIAIMIRSSLAYSSMQGKTGQCPRMHASNRDKKANPDLACPPRPRQ
ncbi:hypothetical protein C2845_PM17G03060 [Panicum miliaceum]|uniref:Uncharacterized protein n=1 Tax=Panicum miliaceum TaxID=4540 RepID=A0A3L6Q012_PANMI|nr:hypothetical protein C2845_PM17G03060 [Panicum miliaceum]